MYIQTGCRRSEPLIGRVQGSLLIVSPELSKSGYQRIVALSESNIETILRMQASGYAAEYYSRKYKESCRAAGVNSLSSCASLKHAHRLQTLGLVETPIGISSPCRMTPLHLYVDQLRTISQAFPN